MKKLFTIILIALFTCFVYPEILHAKVTIYSEKNKFGLQNDNGENITKPEYQKIIRIGDKGVFLVERKKRFGLMNESGDFVVAPKNSRAERVFGKYVKLKNRKGWGLFDENGENIIPQEYSSIDPLFGKMFLTQKHFQYGITNHEGKQLLDNNFEDIYMPNSKTLRIKYDGKWYESAKNDNGEFELPKDFSLGIKDNKYTIKRIATTSGAASGYSVVTATDYSLKIFSSISPAYEYTIDELMLSQGADAISILTKFSWLPKFPFVYAKNYYQNIKNPYNGPLSNVKSNLKQNF